MKPRIHAELIHAFADGADIQMLCEAEDIEVWSDCPNPDWSPNVVYRVKPIDYPKSSLGYNDLCRIWNAAHNVPGGEGVATKALRMCANEAVVWFIRSGEMQKYIDKQT